MYSLRHSSITRQLLRGVPTIAVAKSHDISIKMVEKHYARRLSNHSDGLIRAALLQFNDAVPLAS